MRKIRGWLIGTLVIVIAWAVAAILGPAYRCNYRLNLGTMQQCICLGTTVPDTAPDAKNVYGSSCKGLPIYIGKFYDGAYPLP